MADPIVAALQDLNKERERLNYVSPCQSDPSLWDGHDENDTPETTLDKHAVAAKLCQMTCLAFDQCMKVADAMLKNGSETSGTVAGIWFYNDEPEMAVAYYLEQGSWPEDCDPTSQSDQIVISDDDPPEEMDAERTD